MFRRNYRWIGAGLAVFVLLFSIMLTMPAIAGETRSGRYVSVGADELITDDLYCSGETITIDGTIQGDLVAIGNEIYINGTVEGDLIAAGKTVIIHGTVQDDARIAGFEVEISKEGKVGDDVNAVAFSLVARPGGQVGGDVYVLARQVDIGGQLTGKLVGVMDALRITGTVRGDVSVEVSAPDAGIDQMGPLAQMFPVPLLSSGLHVADAAQIMGKLTYTSPALGDISPQAAIGQQVYQTPVAEGTPVATPAGAVPAEGKLPEAAGIAGVVLGILWWILQIMRRFITLVVIALLLVWLLPIFPKVANKLKEKPWPSLGWGCLVEIVFFIAMPIIFILIIAISLLLGLLTLGGLQGYFAALALLLQGLAAVIFGVITSYVTKIVVAYFVGAWLLGQLNRKSAPSHIIWPTLLGIGIFVILRSIPILGWLVDIAATLFGLGAIWLWVRDRYWPSQPKPISGFQRPALQRAQTPPVAETESHHGDSEELEMESAVVVDLAEDMGDVPDSAFDTDPHDSTGTEANKSGEA